MQSKLSEEEVPHPENTKQDEWNELNQVPRVVVVNVEHDQMVVAKRIEGADDKGSRKGAEEGTPQSLQREVIAHLKRKDIQALKEVCTDNPAKLTSSKLKRTPPMGAPKATLTPAAQAAERI
jgi:hypothetical protein